MVELQSDVVLTRWACARAGPSLDVAAVETLLDECLLTDSEMGQRATDDDGPGMPEAWWRAAGEAMADGAFPALLHPKKTRCEDANCKDANCKDGDDCADANCEDADCSGRVPPRPSRRAVLPELSARASQKHDG